MAGRVYWDLLLQLLDHAAESATLAVAAAAAAVAAESEVDVDDSEAIEEGIPHRSMPLTVRIAAAMRRLLLRRSWLDTNACRIIQTQQKLREVYSQFSRSKKYYKSLPIPSVHWISCKRKIVVINFLIIEN